MSTSSNLSKLTQITTITDLSRVLFSTTDSSFITIGNDETTDSSHNLTFTTSLDTYNDFFVKAFQLKIQTAGDTTNFRIDSELHCIYSIDVSGDKLLFRENWGQNRDASCGYLLFDYDATYLKATNRYAYDMDTSYHIVDSAFTQANTYVKYDNGELKLVSSSENATAFNMYNFPFDVAVPYDFNPGQIAYQTNDRVSIVEYIDKTISNMESVVAQKMMADYTDQISEVGNYPTTAAAAISMLDEIESSLTANGESLRYDKSVYTAFRNGLLSQINNTDSIANGERGQNTVPYVYYTNEQDEQGNYHPFMCIASYSITDRPNHLLDVPRPPGDGTGTYGNSKVTRDATLQDYLFKIPMKKYVENNDDGLITSLTDNIMTTTLYSDYNVSPNDLSENVYNYSSKSGLGVTIDGLVMYPILNNTVVPAQCVAEITSSGFHVGRGMGLHYHADGHGATDNNFNLYNTDDYVGHNHPPLIGFGFDGIALFGRYEDAYSSMHGYDTALDTYGGHEHGNYGYHYHCHTVSVTGGKDTDDVTLFLEDNSVTSLYTTTEQTPTYDLHLLIKGAWKGKINNIPYFWSDETSSVIDSNGDTVFINKGETNAPSYSLSQKHKYVGKDFTV